MKSKIILIVALAFFATAFYQNNSVTQQELRTTCQTLAKLSNTAITKNQKDFVAIYYNAYMAIKKENNFSDCDTYFNDVKTAHAASIGDWSIRMEFPPKKFVTPGKGGFTHKDFEHMLKINKLKLTDLDLQRLMFLNSLEKGNVDVNALKKSNPALLNDISKSLNSLDLENIDTAQFKNLPKKHYDINGFKKALENK